MATKLKLNVDRMMCEGCVINVKKALDKPCMISNVDVKIGKVSLEYDETQISEKEIIALIVDAGYSCSVKKGIF